MSEGDLNPEIGEISLNLSLNSKTGEKSPDRGVHTGMVAGQPWLASSGLRCGTGFHSEPERREPMRRHTEIARVAGVSRVTERVLGDGDRCPEMR